MRFLLFGIVTIALLLALLPHIVFLVAKLVGHIAYFRVGYRPFGMTALMLVVVWVMTAIFGNVYGRFRHEVKQVQLSFESLPAAFDGLRIVHISDLHLDGWEGHGKELQQHVDEINALHPDIICFTGDLISLSPDELKPFVPILRQLRTNQGGHVYAVLGNHDYMPYTDFSDARERKDAVAKLVRMEREELGWTVLLNESEVIRHGGDSIAILGCENQSVGAHPVIQRGDLGKTIQGKEGNFCILLTHDPSQWRKEVLPDTNIPLTLSGHTHAMQFKIGSWSPLALTGKEWNGWYQEGKQSLFVTAGLGGLIPFRFGATGEIVLLTLKKQTE